jgi:hypothetical protein
MKAGQHEILKAGASEGEPNASHSCKTGIPVR